MSKVKICVFADYHYFPYLYPIEQEGLDEIIERAHKENVDVILECGDFAADATKNDGFLQKFLNNKYGIKTTFCYGNHDLERVDSLELLNKAYGVDNSYFYRDMFGFRFITVDTNFWYDDDGTLHHYAGRTVGPPKWNYPHSLFGKKQLEWLSESIDKSEYPCIIIGHVPMEKSNEPEPKEFMKILREANEKKPGKVLIYFSGHTHRNHIQVVDNVIHFNVNATYNGEWQPKQHNLFPKELTDKYKMAANCSIFKDPLSAIVTVEDNGHIKIEGTETGYLYGVAPEMYGGPFNDSLGYGFCEPRISSAEFFLYNKK